MLLGVVVRDDQECGSLEKNNFVCVQSFAECLEVLLQNFDVRQQKGYDLRPCLVEGLVPDRSLEAFNFKPAIDLPLDVALSLLKRRISGIFVEQIHLVNQAENLGFGRELAESSDAVFKLLHILLVVFGGHIEHVNQNLNVLENVVSLALEELLHKGILSSAVPKTQHQVAQEPDARFGYVNRKGDPVGVSRQVVRKNNGPHRSFTRTDFPHQQNFLSV